MNRDLTGRKLAIIGGDKRELVLMEKLVSRGAEVLVVGYEKISQLPCDLAHQQLKDTLSVADAVILPMPGTDEQGRVKAEFAAGPLMLQPEYLDLLKPGTPVLVGIASSYLKSETRKRELRLVETAELDDIAVYNSIPTAEGAIEIAMGETTVTLHGSHLLIFGFGRIGMTLARMLKGIGAHVSVVARKAADLARAEEQGYRSLDYQTVTSVLDQFTVVFNTVPYPVVTKAYLSKLKPDTVLIELASPPRGIDVGSAESLGLKVIKAMGLPGKAAPVTAGKILGRVYPKLLQELWEQTESKGGAQ